MYVFCGEILEEVQSHPYLGIVLDQKMRWSLHITNITSKANRLLGSNVTSGTVLKT